MHLIRTRLAAVRHEQGGFAMVTVLAVLLVASLIAAAAVSATDNDTVVSKRDKERKMAYAAAEAGVNDYLARLVSNVDYWRKCGNDASNASLNQRITSPSDPRKWATVPGNADARYSVEVLPANGKLQCAETDPMGTYIDTATGTFRIRATGQIRSTGDKRSIVATFKRRGFLDYVYFTDYETLTPKYFLRESRGLQTRQRNVSGGGLEVVPWAEIHCARYYRDGGQRDVYYGERNVGTSSWPDFNAQCGEIQFVTGDEQNGPFHTNDEILVNGSPKFGRKPSDDIEISAPNGDGTGSGSDSGWRGSGAPSVNDPSDTTPDPNLGTWRKGSPKVEMPPSNTTLKNEALPAYRFKGKVKLQLEGKKMRIMETAAKRETMASVPAGTVMDLPKDGVIWVANDPADDCDGYSPIDGNYSEVNGCGDVWVKGDYDYSVTIAAQNDIVVWNSITRDAADDVMLGLIADQWVRVYHPVSGSTPYDSCSNNSSPTNVKIHGAILAVNHSFTVDRYWCGAKLGDLTVQGAIAQKFRGPVGTGGGTGTGYLKDYNYDDRLRFRTPPHFLDPVQASWKIQSQVEQVPAT